MATLYKTVRQDGTGNYTNLASGVTDILASGLAATGYYNEYILSVDNGEYSGYFEAEVPYTGCLYIIGSGTWFVPSQTSVISGIQPMMLPNVEIENFCIRGNLTNTIFDVYSDSALNIKNSEFIETTIGISNSGHLELDNVSAHGVGSGCFIVDYGSSVITNSRITYFASGIYTTDCNINNAVFVDNFIHLIGYSGIMSISEMLMYGGGSGIIFECTPTGELFINSSTISVDIPLQVSGINFQISESILQGASYCIYGSAISGIVSDSCLYPSGCEFSITEDNVINTNPKFKDSTNGDFRLKFRQVTGSPCVELKDRELFADSVELYTEQAQFFLNDKTGIKRTNDFMDFIYKQNNTLYITDYDKEIKFAEMMKIYSDLDYNIQMIANFEASGVPTRASINLIYSPFPYDWDYKTIQTPEITDRHRYIIPRSVVDVTDTISDYIGKWLPQIEFSNIDKRTITPYMYGDYRGVSFDYDLSIGGKAVVWMLEGLNQKLLKLNAYTGEQLAEYPLFVPDISTNPEVKLSGLLFVGVEKDQYKFILESDPNYELLCDNRDGKFQWISTELNVHLDARGLLAYKDSLFVTATDYRPQAIYDRTTIPVYDGSKGILFRYDNNNTFEHFIANYTSNSGPSGFLLASGNAYPTDLTMYEDGRIIVADWNQRNMLFKYKLAYDYAIVQSSYDTETRILLRENYTNVDL